MDGIEPMSVKQFYEEDIYKGFMFANEQQHYVYQDAGAGELVKFGALKVMDTYEERYLKVHSLCSGRIYHEPCMVPMYMPITVSVAVNLDHGNIRQFYRTMLGIHRFTNRLPEVIAFPNVKNFKLHTEIMMYDKPPTEGIYDDLDPERYVTFTTMKRHATDNHVYQSVYPSSGPDPPERPRIRKKSVHKKEPEPDKSRLPTPPPDYPFLEQRGGARGPNTYVYAMSRQGYYVVDVETRDALEELNQVLTSGIIPDVSVVNMVDVSEFSKSLFGKRSSTLGTSQMSSNDFPPPVIPRTATAMIRPSVQPPTPARNPAPGIAGVIQKLNMDDIIRDISSHAPRIRKISLGNNSQGPEPEMYDFIRDPVQLMTPVGLKSVAGPPPPPRPLPGPKAQLSMTLSSNTPGQKITSFSDFPDDITSLDCEEIGDCLNLLNLSKHRDTFMENQIDGNLLVDLDITVLQVDLNLTKLDALKLAKFAKGWRPKDKHHEMMG